MGRRKKVSPYYLAISNYLHNELKLTREDINEIIEEKTQSAINKRFNGIFANPDNYLRQEITKIVKEHLYRSGLGSVADEEIRKIIREKFDITVTINISEKKLNSEED